VAEKDNVTGLTFENVYPHIMKIPMIQTIFGLSSIYYYLTFIMLGTHSQIHGTAFANQMDIGELFLFSPQI
jgi:hypothetical protein